MEYRYANKKSGLKAVADKTEQFLVKHDFLVSKKEEQSAVRFVGIKRQEEHVMRRVEIAVYELGNDLGIRFDWGEDLGNLMKSTLLLQFLGGGLILRKRIQAADFYRKIEEEYWHEIELAADFPPSHH